MVPSSRFFAGPADFVALLNLHHLSLQCFRAHLQEHLSHIPLSCSQKARKVLALCQQHGFSKEALTVCRVMARRELSRRRFGSALAWCRHVSVSNLLIVGLLAGWLPPDPSHVKRTKPRVGGVEGGRETLVCGRVHSHYFLK